MNTVAPEVSGTAEVGSTLTTDDGTWTGNPTPTYSYQWQRCEGDVGAWGGYSGAVGTETTLWRDITYGGTSGSEQFVAVGNNLAAGTPSSRVMTSPNGVSWTARSDSDPSTTGNDWRSVAYGEGLFVAIGTVPGIKAMTSPDGINWTYRDLPTNSSDPSINSNNWVSVAYGEGRFVAVNDIGNVIVSEDGLTWTVAPTPPVGPGLFFSIAYGGGDFVVGGADRSFKSADGNTWVQGQDPPGNLALTDVTYGDGRWVAVGLDGFAASSTALISTDGSTWTQTNMPASREWMGVTFSDGLFTAVARGPGTNDVAVSPDGTTWTGQVSPALSLWAVAGGAGTTVAVGIGSSGVADAVARPAYTCTDISGATASSYTLTGTDEGKKIRAKVMASNSQGATYALSPATNSVNPRPFPANTSPPTVSGTAEVGGTLSAVPGAWSGSPSYTYQWEQCVAALTTTTYAAGDLAAYPTLDSDGNVYVTNQGDNDVTRISRTGVVSDFGSTGAGTTPFGIAIDPYRNIYTANQGNNTVTKLSANGTPAGSPWPAATGAAPTGIAVDSSGNVFTSNKNVNNVTKILPDGSLAGGVTNWASTGLQPYGIDVDPAGNVYTANYLSNTVSKIMANGTPANNPPWPVSTGSLTRPVGLVLDSAGTIYTSNFNQDSLTKIVASDGTAERGWAYTNYQPWGIAVDPFGNIYTADSGDDSVTKILPDGTSIYLSVDTGSQPRGIAVDSAGNIYTANAGSDDVTRISQYTCSDISGAVNSSYTLAESDQGKLIRARVVGSNPTGTGRATSATTAAIAPATAPTNLGVPTISGTPEVGRTLTADPGAWTGNPTFAYQWQRCDADGNNCVDISGATSQAYLSTAADEGKKLRVRVTASNSGGTASATSGQTAIIQPAPSAAPANSSLPTITGPGQVGSTLAASPGTWTGGPTLTYQWLRCDANGDNCVEITGANSETYELTSADEGKKIRLKVTGTNSAGSSSATSDAVGPISGGPDEKPKLKVWVDAPRKVKAGKPFWIGIRVKNTASDSSVRNSNLRTGSSTARNVKTCASLPRSIFVARAMGGKVEGRSICWKRSQLKAGQTISYSVQVRTSKTDQGSTRISATSSATGNSGATAKAKAEGKVRVVKPKRPEPAPPTG